MGRAGVWAIIAVALVGCGARPPAEDLRYAGDIRSREVSRGAEVFAYICAACHDGRVNPRGYHWSPGQMRRQVREGNRLMPAIRPHLVSESDLEAVLAYLSTIDAVEGSLPPPPLAPAARFAALSELERREPAREEAEPTPHVAPSLSEPAAEGASSAEVASSGDATPPAEPEVEPDENAIAHEGDDRTTEGWDRRRKAPRSQRPISR